MEHIGLPVMDIIVLLLKEGTEFFLTLNSVSQWINLSGKVSRAQEKKNLAKSYLFIECILF